MPDIPKIKIPKEGGNILPEELKQIPGKIKEMNFVLITVVVILLVMVASIVIDSARFNSTVYKEYSEKIDTLNSMKEANIELLEQNKENQEIIIELENQIIELLNKK